MRPLPIFVFLATLLAATAPVLAVDLAVGEQRVDPAPIAIVIDDLGNQLASGVRALNLPATLTYAFLPYAPYTRQLAELAHQMHREVMLHLPMDSIERNRLGKGGLRLEMPQETFQAAIREGLQAVPYAKGINNHMGSLLTRHKRSMEWLMDEIRRHEGLYFVDSRTTKFSVAMAAAQTYRVPAMSRDVFLDQDRNPDSIRRQFEKLLDRAADGRGAVAIGHPYKETLDFLAQALPRLEARGIIVVPVSDLIFLRGAMRAASAPVEAAEESVPVADATPLAANRYN